jgi:hypothetical protein
MVSTSSIAISQTAYIPLPSTPASYPGRVDARYGLRTLGPDPITHFTFPVITDMNVDAVNPSCHCLTPSATRAEFHVSAEDQLLVVHIQFIVLDDGG